MTKSEAEPARGVCDVCGKPEEWSTPSGSEHLCFRHLHRWIAWIMDHPYNPDGPQGQVMFRATFEAFVEAWRHRAAEKALGG